MKILRITDKDGYFLRDDFTFSEYEIGLDVIPSQGLYLPKWNGMEWVEGGIKPQPQPYVPTLDDRVKSVEEDNEAIIDLIAIEMGVTL